MSKKHSTLTLEVHSLDDVFDMRDHAPIPKRRLDPEWLEYVFELMENKPRHEPFHLTLHIEPKVLEGHPSNDLAADIYGQLTVLNKSLKRKLQENFRIGRISLGYGLLTLAAFIGLSEAVTLLHFGALQQPFQEGFLIIGWVALWRPVELLLYDWWPIAAQRKKVARLLKGKITINTRLIH